MIDENSPQGNSSELLDDTDLPLDLDGATFAADALEDPAPDDVRPGDLAAFVEYREAKRDARHFLLMVAMRHFGKPSNWEASKDPAEVLAFMRDLASDPAKLEEHHIIPQRDLFAAVVLPYALPLEEPDLQKSARWVSDKSLNNLDSGDTQATFSQIQSIRAKIGGAKRRKNSASERQPWTYIGVSRRTWYRRLKGKAAGTHGGDRKSQKARGNFQVAPDQVAHEPKGFGVDLVSSNDLSPVLRDPRVLGSSLTDLSVREKNPKTISVRVPLDRPTECNLKPWEALGISRRAWYYHKAGRHTGRHGGNRAKPLSPDLPDGKARCARLSGDTTTTAGDAVENGISERIAYYRKMRENGREER